MNEILNAMIHRRSIRSFKPDMPERKLIEEVIEAGLYAPSGMNRQATKILAVTDPKLRKRLTDVNRKIMGAEEDYDPFYGAPVILIVLADKAAVTAVYDGSLVMGNLLLGAYSLGLGSIWIHRAKEEFETEEFRSLLKDLGIEGDWEGIGHCALGYVQGEYPDVMERMEIRVYWLE